MVKTRIVKLTTGACIGFAALTLSIVSPIAVKTIFGKSADSAFARDGSGSGEGDRGSGEKDEHNAASGEIGDDGDAAMATEHSASGRNGHHSHHLDDTAETDTPPPSLVTALLNSPSTNHVVLHHRKSRKPK